MGGRRRRREPPALAEARLQPSLASGVVLCAVANAMRPGIVPKVARDSNVVGLNPEVQTRRQRENIANFLEAAAELGLERRELFNVADLHDNRNWKGVLKTILALAKADVPGYHGPRLGVAARRGTAPRRCCRAAAPAAASS